jgi:hypothetical protein
MYNLFLIYSPHHKIPFFAALPIPTITAVGVANPMAHGQEITSTAMARKKESVIRTSKAKKEIKYLLRGLKIMIIG